MENFKKRYVKVFVSFGIILSFVVYFTIVSGIKFGVVNPIASGIGVIQIIAFNTKYVEIQSSPRVIIAKPNNSWQLFIKTIKSEGYTYLENEQMGSICTIRKGGVKEAVIFSTNEYYSKWSWVK